MRQDTSPPNPLATLGGLARDAAGGANLTLAMLPKALAYAAVAGVPPAYGLYASCAAPPSRSPSAATACCSPAPSA
jgi:MFS superfamily sulfate permease-like transporter